MRQRLIKRQVKKEFNNKLVCADLHLTDNIKDEYRWKIFSWLADRGMEGGYERPKSLYIIGDLCDRKDHHSANLVNRLIGNFKMLLDVFTNIVVVKGNHDYDKDELTPFFNFISSIPNMNFINEPKVIDNSLFLPHTRTKIKEWNTFDFNKYSHVYLHTMILGAKLHDGYISEEGLAIEDFKSFKDTMFISGDIHIPQDIGSNFKYVGSPYPIKFGDDYKGRVLFVKDNSILSIPHNSIRKHSWKIFTKSFCDDTFGLKDYRIGDHVKIEIHLHQSEFQEYYKLRKSVTEFCKDKKLELFSIEMKPIKSRRITLKEFTNKLVSSDLILKEFCDQQKLSKEQLEIGKKLL